MASGGGYFHQAVSLGPESVGADWPTHGMFFRLIMVKQGNFILVLIHEQNTSQLRNLEEV